MPLASTRSPSLRKALRNAGTVRAAAGCLVLDVRLPGMSGFELYRALRQSGIEPPVIFITAHDEPSAREQAAQAGAVAYLAKPFHGRRLVDAVNRALAGSDPDAADEQRGLGMEK
jgi:FixJ family two-component response regulator